MNLVLPFPAMGMAVFPLIITGFNGARDTRRSPSHMEILKERKKEKKEERKKERESEKEKETKKELVCCCFFYFFCIF